MLFYIIIALLTTFFYRMALANKDSKPTLCLYATLFLLLPSIIGGCRDVTVGTDTTVYGTLYFDEAVKSSSLFEYLTDMPSTEYAYFFLNYICSLFGGINFFLFTLELVKIALVGVTAYRMRNRTDSVLYVFTYMMFFYWSGLSLMRQSAALCVAMLAISFYLENKRVIFFLLMCLTFLFHSSGIFLILTPFVDFLYKKTRWPIATNVIFLVIVYSFSISMLLLLADSPLFRDGMIEDYLDSGVTLAKVNILMAVFIMVLSFLPLYSDEIEDEDGKEEDEVRNKIDNHAFAHFPELIYLVRINSIYALIFLLMSNMFEIAFRISFYNMITLMLAFTPMIMHLRSDIMKVSTKGVYILLFFLYYYLNYKHGLAETIPYTSAILGLSIG